MYFGITKLVGLENYKYSVRTRIERITIELFLNTTIGRLGTKTNK